MKVRLYLLAGLGLAVCVAITSRLSADSMIIEVNPSKTIDLGSQETNKRVPVVSSVALSPTGEQMATAGDDHLVRIWDFKEGKVLRSLVGHGDWVRAVAFGQKGKLLATAGDDRRIRIWDLEKETAKYSIPVSHTVIQTLAFSPNGQLLAAGGFGNEIVLIRMTDGQIDRKLTAPGPDAIALAFSPDGSQLAAAGRNGTIRIWTDKQHTGDLVGHKRRVRALAYSPNGKQLASAGDEREIWIWDMASAKPVAKLPKQTAKPLVLRFCTGDYLASGGSDNMIRIWNLREGCEVFALKGHTGSVTTLVWNPETQTLVSGSFDTTIRVWNLNLDAIDQVSQQDSKKKIGK